MKPYQLAVSACILAFLATGPAALAAARECIVPQPTPASNTWNFRHEANSIFRDIQSDAWQARYHANRLQSMVDRADQVSWLSDGIQLNQISSAVDDMGRQVCRLETIRRAVDPWQQKAIDRISVDVMLLADNTQDAVAFGNSHTEELWMPAYQRYVDSLYTEARTLTHSTATAVARANAKPAA